MADKNKITKKQKALMIIGLLVVATILVISMCLPPSLFPQDKQYIAGIAIGGIIMTAGMAQALLIRAIIKNFWFS